MCGSATTAAGPVTDGHAESCVCECDGRRLAARLRHSVARRHVYANIPPPPFYRPRALVNSIHRWTVVSKAASDRGRVAVGWEPADAAGATNGDDRDEGQRRAVANVRVWRMGPGVKWLP